MQTSNKHPGPFALRRRRQQQRGSGAAAISILIFRSGVCWQAARFQPIAVAGADRARGLHRDFRSFVLRRR